MITWMWVALTWCLSARITWIRKALAIAIQMLCLHLITILSTQSSALCYGARHHGHSRSFASTGSIWVTDTTTPIWEKKHMLRLWVTIERYCSWWWWRGMIFGASIAALLQSKHWSLCSGDRVHMWVQNGVKKKSSNVPKMRMHARSDEGHAHPHLGNIAWFVYCTPFQTRARTLSLLHHRWSTCFTQILLPWDTIQYAYVFAPHVYDAGNVIEDQVAMETSGMSVSEG